jgi:hypothetical protein
MNIVKGKTDSSPWIVFPCQGTLKEIHEVLIGDLQWVGQPVTVNGWGYTLSDTGFISNEDHKEKSFECMETLHPGRALFVDQDMLLDNAEICAIVTLDRVPHVSKRCQLCGDQLLSGEINQGACNSCFAREVGS